MFEKIIKDNANRTLPLSQIIRPPIKSIADNHVVINTTSIKHNDINSGKTLSAAKTASNLAIEINALISANLLETRPSISSMNRITV